MADAPRVWKKRPARRAFRYQSHINAHIRRRRATRPQRAFKNEVL